MGCRESKNHFEIRNFFNWCLLQLLHFFKSLLMFGCCFIPVSNIFAISLSDLKLVTLVDHQQLLISYTFSSVRHIWNFLQQQQTMTRNGFNVQFKACALMTVTQLKEPPGMKWKVISSGLAEMTFKYSK